VPAGALPASLTSRMAAVRRTGTTLKLNLALRGLPRFSCLPADSPSPFGSTIHLLPGSAGLAGPAGADSPMAALRAMWADVQAGRLPAEPTIEWYLHTTVDPSLQDAEGHHSSALFVQSVPFEPAGSSWAAELPGYVDRLLDICERYAPGTRDLVVDMMPLTPPGIEEHFGITGGHIHHVDNTVAFNERMPYFTGLDGLYAGSAGAHPAGSVIGAAGHNAAKRILRDLGKQAKV
jgi:phytoene dehydrogenase-like protein